MTTIDPERHLLRAGEGSASRRLGAPTGLARIALEERTLGTGERAGVAGPATAEGFLYVLAGAGRVSIGNASEDLGTGDFLGLSPGEALVLENPCETPLTVLIGFSEGGPGGPSPP